MFDSVGRNIDDEALKRQAQSVGIATLIAGLVGGIAIVGTLYKVKEIVTAPVVDMEIVEAELPEAEDLVAPPPPPPPPPSGGAQDEEEDETTPTPEEMQDPQELKQEIKEEIKSDSKPAGVEGGVEGGVAGGVVGGVQGGVVGGVLGGQLGASGIKVVHHSQIDWKKEPAPTYPKAALGMGLGDQLCKTTITINTEGVPTDAKVDGCPPVFFEGTKSAVFAARAYPPKANGIKVPVQTVIVFRYTVPGSN